MHLLYEEDGELKAGTVLERSPASFHVESPHGRRSKIKAANVLLAFERPAAAELLGEAEKFSRELEVQFLWECSGAREFGFEELARDYVGRAPTPVEAAGVLMRLHAAPMYFYRRGKGRFQAAPEATLKLALASAEKKKRIQEQVAAWAKQLEEGACPAEISRLKDELLYAPDRNRPETRALEQACAKSGLTPARLFERCGQLPDSHDYHLKRFLHEFFPHGTGFPAHELPRLPEDLARAPVGAFSLDDIGTTEIDDAFSVQSLASGGVRVGIHIAAPALGFLPGSPLDAIARERLSTAYMPGRKFTMLPQDVIECFSLDHGGELPAISLYVDFAADHSILARHSRLERVPIVANLRHADYDVLNESFGKGETRGLAYETELNTLWRAAEALEARRGKPAAGAALDYTFYVEDQRVRILPRKRGVPLDKLVSEMMILANSSWGELLAERDVAAIYRVQSTGKVRFSVHAEPHEGLGVAAYAWMSSPLRRYVDLVNQWQLAAALGGRRAPFGRTSDALLSALRAFELTYARYDEHQRAMETYWSLRWLQQEAVASLEAVVLRENVVRIDGLPLVTRVSSLPALEPLTRVRLEVAGVDLIERTLACTYRDNLGRAAANVADSADDTGQKAQNMKGL